MIETARPDLPGRRRRTAARAKSGRTQTISHRNIDRMVRYERTYFVRAPVEEAFSYATDQRNLPRWSPEILSSKKISDGPLEVGTKLKQVRRVGKHEVVTEAEVVEHDPPTRHAVRIQLYGVEATFDFTFKTEPPGTRARMVAVLKGSGIGRLMEKRIARRMERADDHLLVRLARAVEER